MTRRDIVWLSSYSSTRSAQGTRHPTEAATWSRAQDYTSSWVRDDLDPAMVQTATSPRSAM